VGELVELKVGGLVPDGNSSGSHILLLKIPHQARFLPIWIGTAEASSIAMVLRGQAFERPLTHDLMLQIFKGLGVSIERVVITELKDSTYYARLILKQENELGTKLVELDARPSDCLALASAKQVPVYVAKSLFDKVEDMSEHLDRIKEGSQGEE